MREQPSQGFLACTMILLMVCWFPLASASHRPAPNEIVFTQDHGHTEVDRIELNGTSNFPLRDTSWSLVELGSSTQTVILTGPHLTSVIPLDDHRFSWTLSINATGVSCVCYVALTPESGAGAGESFQLVVYIGDASDHLPVLFNDVPGELVTLPATNDADVTNGWVNVTYFSTIAGNGWEAAQVTAEVCEAPSQVCLEPPVPVPVSTSMRSTTIDVAVDLRGEGYNDGVWLLQFKVTDQVLRQSNTIGHLVVLDTMGPSLSLAAPVTVTERSTLHVLANVDDGYDGSLTTATWTLIHNNESVRNLNSSELIDQHHAVLNLSTSGHYELQVVVRDRAGFTTTSTHEFLVENIRPNAVLTLDGLELRPGQTVVVDMSLNWSIQASERDDNEPVDFLWVIDNSTSVRGAQQLDAETLSSAGLHDVELIVFDDDGSSDRISVTINILSQPDEQHNSMNVTLWTGVGLLMALMVGFFALIQRDSNPDELPKWSKRSSGNEDDEESANQRLKNEGS